MTLSRAADVAAIDAALGCLQCSGPLDDSPSDLFCSSDHQIEWASARAAGDDSWLDPRYNPELADLVAAFRLPRQTGDLAADRRALDRATQHAFTRNHLEACALRARQLDERAAAEPPLQVRIYRAARRLLRR